MKWVREQLMYKQILPGIAELPLSPYFGQLVPLFWKSKMTFCAYDRKNADDDNDGCNDNYDANEMKLPNNIQI